MKTFSKVSTARPLTQTAVSKGASALAKAAGLSLAVLVAASFSNPAQAQQPAPVRVTQADASSLRIRINNPKQQVAQLRVIHLGNGNRVLDEIHREPAYGTLMKFDTLPAGRYALVLRIGPDQYRYTVDLKNRPQGKTLAVRELTTRHTEDVLAAL